MAVLTVIKAYHHYRQSTSGWVMQLHKDGIIFYAFLLRQLNTYPMSLKETLNVFIAISLANLVVPVFAPSMFANWLATPQRVFHSIICTRVLLLILRQRSAALVNHLPGAGDAPELAEMFTSAFDEVDTTASMQITTMETRTSESSLAGGTSRWRNE
ncbi:hypothetical protein H0H92_006479 [Tricholoma furcatifolium]|nr:hypothetical protein H0H92_006479 [Tricholoma furcatifolium]